MITIGFFFLMTIGQVNVAMGAYADEISCLGQAQMMEQSGATVSACYATAFPPPDSTVELERDSES